MLCSKCGKEVSSDSMFCPECGAKQEAELKPKVKTGNGLTKYCASCGCQMPLDSRFCPGCKTKQEETQSPSKVTASTSKVSQQFQTGVLSPKEESNLKKRNKMIAICVSSVLGVCLIIALLSVVMKPTINLNKYLTVSVEGYNTVGKAVVRFDKEKFRSDYEKKLGRKVGKKSIGFDNYENEEAYLESLFESSASGNLLSNCVNGSINIQNGLSNGDIVTYTWDCNDEYAMEKYGYKLIHKDVEYKVADLVEAETFDPFDGIEVMFEGISPSGSARISGETKASAAQDLRYDLDNYEGFSNGDKVTMTISNNYGEDPIEYCIENYGMIPSPLTKEYTVEGLNSYIRSFSDVSEVSLREMQSQAEDVYYAEMARNWGEDETLKSFTYIGNYFLTNKSRDDYGGSDNALYLVYKVQVVDEYSNGGNNYNIINDIYWYISYNNLYMNSQGESVVNVTEYNKPRDTVKLGINSDWWSTRTWYYDGYQTLEKLYTVVVTSNSEAYNHEDNVKKSVMVSEIDQNATGQNGVIFPNSSEKLLNKENVATLSDEVLRYAINELYARHGYIFKDDELKNYYEKFDWYRQEIKPDDFSMDFFNEIEKENVEMLQKERDGRN